MVSCLYYTCNLLDSTNTVTLSWISYLFVVVDTPILVWEPCFIRVGDAVTTKLFERYKPPFSNLATPTANSLKSNSHP